MYEKVFQLDSRPFVSTPDVERFYSARVVHQALTKACSTIDRASGTVLIVGPTGSGKTLFLNMIEDQFRSVYRVVNLACARLAERHDLLQNILFELNQPYLNMSEGELRLALIDYLKPGMECPNGILLLVDDAHLLTPALFDEIRLLTNLVRDGLPRAQLVLAGNMRLEENLMDSSLESFNQRIAARCYLENFTAAETEGYIFAAIARAGGLGNEIFTLDGIEAVYEVSQGCPRLVNQVCDHAMILAASTNTTTIDAECIHEAWADVQHMPNSWAEAAAQTMQSRDDVACEVEFGSLEDGTDCQFEFADSDSPEFSEDFRDEIKQVPHSPESSLESWDEEGQWSEIEFGQLSDNESEQLATLSDYEQVTETIEVTYEFEQVIEPTSVNTVDNETETDVVEEYQLAPPEPVAESMTTMDDFSDELETSDNQEGLLNVNDYVDVRFRDLAQFLANGGGVGSNKEQRDPNESEEVDDQDQIIIQGELDRAVQESHSLVVDEVADDFDETELDAQLNEIMQTQTPEIKVFQVEEDSEVALETERQSWKDLFSESFEQEELVYDPYTALVVEQNTQSLSLTRVELSVLEDNYQEEDPQIVDSESPEAVECNGDCEVEQFQHVEETIDEFPSSHRFDEEKLAMIDGVDEQDLLETIQKQQAEIADQIFKLKKDLAGTGAVRVEGMEVPTHLRSENNNEPVDVGEEAPVKLETPLESVDNDDRDILVITRVERHDSPVDQQGESLDDDTPVSKGRAIRMEYSQLFKQLRAAE